MSNTVYQYPLKDIHGKPLDLAIYKGKKLLLVNTASECGYTPQYKQLQELYETHKEHLVVIGLPCNDFGGQEPGTETQIESFCEVNYGVTFPLTAKVKITGSDVEPVYQFLTKKELNGYADTEVKWNFHKFLCNEKGELVGSFGPAVEPFSEEMMKAVTN